MCLQLTINLAKYSKAHSKVTPITGFIRNFGHIFQRLFQDISRTIHEFFQDFPPSIAINEMALKAPSNTAGGLGRFECPHWVQGRALVGVQEEPPKILYFVVFENELKIHIFPVCFSTKTQDKVIKIATQCFIRQVCEAHFGSDSHMENTYYQNCR